MRRPRCQFSVDSKRCRRLGMGNPPLCGQHFAMYHLAADEGSLLDELVEDAYELFGEHRGLGDMVLGALGDMLSSRKPVPLPIDPRRSARVGRRPAPPVPPRPQPQRPDPRLILHFGADEPLDRPSIERRRRDLAALCHPDKGGSTAAMSRINEAADALLAKLG